MTVEMTMHKHKLSGRTIVGNGCLYVFLVALAVVFLFPYAFMVCRGLMTNTRFAAPVMHFFPDRIKLSNYVHAFNEGGFGMPLVNSLWLCLLTSVLTAVSSLVPAYAFTRLKWIGKNVMFAFMMATVMLPGIATQVPLYVMYSQFGMLNTFFPLFVPNLLFGGAMNVFLARQFLLSHPNEMYESATIDGAGPFRSFLSITIPLSKTIFLYIAVSVFMGMWGDYYTPSIYITLDSAPKTFALALYQSLWSQNNIAHPEWTFSACTVLSVTPTVLYAVFQKYLVQGIATAGIKG